MQDCKCALGGAQGLGLWVKPGAQNVVQLTGLENVGAATLQWDVQ